VIATFRSAPRTSLQRSRSGNGRSVCAARNRGLRGRQRSDHRRLAWLGLRRSLRRARRQPLAVAPPAATAVARVAHRRVGERTHLSRRLLMRPAGFEPATRGLEDRSNTLWVAVLGRLGFAWVRLGAVDCRGSGQDPGQSPVCGSPSQRQPPRRVRLRPMATKGSVSGNRSIISRQLPKQPEMLEDLEPS
jgi:hypothetical protein